MKSLIKAAVGMALGAALSFSAAAQTTFTFGDFAGTAQNGDGSFDFMIGTLGLNARAFTFEDFDDLLPFQTAAPNSGLFIDPPGGSQGLRIDNDLFFPGSDDSSQIDGSNFNEIVVFTFNQSVELLSINFDAVGPNDDFSFITDAIYSPGNGVLGSSVFTADIPGGASIFNFNPAEGPTSSFGVAAIGDNDDFVIRNLTVNVVPEPATWLMMIVGFALVGLTVQRRRRIAAA